MSSKAVLTCRPNSHPFPERTLILDQPVKIGRSVARARPAPNNAIFDCKVLSRNHALIWYSNGKFYLQDTKSSNGTFVNNHRLSKSAEESLPREVCSGDIVQFGVDVLENTRKVTHGCIIANLKLYLPDGKEAKASLSTSVMPNNGFPLEHIYELHQYLQEAAQRELLLENKLVNLQETLNTMKEAVDKSWKALIAEDRLLTRIDVLESQLMIYSKNYGEDKLKEEIRKLHDDKNAYQNAAKEFIKKVLEEKLEAVQKYQDLKITLLNIQEQYKAVNEELTISKIHVQELAVKLSIQMSRTQDTDEKRQEMEEEYRVVISELQRRNEELEKFLELHKDEETLVRGHLVVGYRVPGSPITIPCALRTSPIQEKELADEEEHSLLSSAGSDSSDEMINSNTDLYTAQLQLLQCYVQDNQHSVEQGHINSQIRPELEKVSNGCDEELESKQLLQDEIKEIKSSEDYGGISISVREELNASNELLTKSALPPSAKFVENASEVYDDCNMIKEALSTESKLNEEFVIDGSPQDEFENHLNKRNQSLEEKDIIRKQLVEAEQSAKQSRNEAAQLAVKLKFVSSELESLMKQQQEQAVDNKLKDELHKLTHDYFKSKGMVSLLEEEIQTLKENFEKLQSENVKLTEQLKKYSDNSEDSDSLSKKVSELEDSLILVGHKYMECNEEKAQLRRQLNDLQLDYQAISHQPYFNLLFALPCIMLLLAVTIAFYPTLSKWMGTADPPDNDDVEL